MLFSSLTFKSTSSFSKRLTRSSHNVIKLFNSLSEKVEPLDTDAPLITWYSCGPTVYDDMHIGHAASFIRQDCIRRVINRYHTTPVVLALGVTDVDDKIIARAKMTGQSEKQLAQKFERRFFQDLDRLNVLQPDVVFRVSDVIPQVIRFVSSLIDKGHAYVTKSGNVFFDSESYNRPGKFDPAARSGQQLDRENVVARSPTKFHPEKRKRADFALWKAKVADEVSWICPWGEGRPGWHIECSTFCDLLTEGKSKLTLHSGGMDLKFPHHNNEICQSEAYYSTDQWAQYFIHLGTLCLSETGHKMSKSLGNFVTVSDFLAKMGTADEFRVTSLRRSYRSTLMYSNEDLIESKKILRTISHALSVCDEVLDFKGVSKTSQPDWSSLEDLQKVSSSFDEALCNDFNFPAALESLTEFSEKLAGNVSPSIIETSLSRQFIWSSLGVLGIEMAVGQRQTNEKLLLVELERFRNSVRTFALGKHLKLVGGAKPSKEDLQRHSMQNKELLKECDRARDFINSLTLTPVADDKIS